MSQIMPESTEGDITITDASTIRNYANLNSTLNLPKLSKVATTKLKRSQSQSVSTFEGFSISSEKSGKKSRIPHDRKTGDSSIDTISAVKISCNLETSLS
jgi:hypothetical protein